MTKNTFLENRLAEAISKSDIATIKKVLLLLNREPTQKEKEAIVVSGKNKTPDIALEAIRFTGLKEHITPEFILEFAKQETANFTKVEKLHPEPDTIEAIISQCVSAGEILEAVQYAHAISRSLSKKEIFLCLENALAKEDFDDPSTITAVKQLLCVKTLPLKYRRILIEKYKSNYCYTEFKHYGGKSSNLTIAWFKEFIRLNIQSGNLGIALDLVAEERLYRQQKLSKDIKGLFIYISDKGAFYREMSPAIRSFAHQVPKKIASEFFIELMNNSNGATPTFFVEKLGFTMNNETFSAYLKLLKRIKVSTDRLELYLETADKFYRKLTKKEKTTILHYISRSGNYELFFKYAEKYSFEPTSYMIKTLQERNT
jgi:hypothetical protein